jgi:acetyl esterase/lipase
MKNIILLFSLLIITSSTTHGQTKADLEKQNQDALSNYNVSKNTSYGDDAEQIMDIYVSKESSNNNLTIVFMHGGGWYMSDKQDVQRYIQPYLLKGINVINLNYRLKKGVATASEDLTEALNYIQNNNAKYFLNLKRVVLSGFSSGGHMAALIGLSANNKTYKPKLNKAIKVVGIVDFSGPVDQLEVVEKRFIDWKLQISKELTSTDIGNAMFRYDGYAPKDSIIKYEPITYFDKNDPPFFLWYGGNDDQVFPRTFENFTKLVHQDKIKNEIVFVPNAGHSPKSNELKDAYDQIFKFLDKL